MLILTPGQKHTSKTCKWKIRTFQKYWQGLRTPEDYQDLQKCRAAVRRRSFRNFKIKNWSDILEFCTKNFNRQDRSNKIYYQIVVPRHLSTQFLKELHDNLVTWDIRRPSFGGKCGIIGQAWHWTFKHGVDNVTFVDHSTSQTSQPCASLRQIAATCPVEIVHADLLELT